MKIDDLTCEYLSEPTGIDVRTPRLGWSVSSIERGSHQTAYRILVASNRLLLKANQADLWDSGRISSAASQQIEYAGVPLCSNIQCWWKVQVWDEQERPSEWSHAVRWTMGLLNPADWRGRWIRGNASVSYLRRAFVVDRQVRFAQLHVTARGIFEMHLNGGRIGKDYFMPGWSEYRSRLLYATYDVTRRLSQGENVLGGMLAPGWHSGFISPELRNDYYGGDPASLLAQLDIEFEDGTRTFIGTDSLWRSCAGPIRFAEFLLGEEYDARLEMPGWHAAGFDVARWDVACVVEAPSARLCHYPVPAVQVHKELAAIQVSEHRAGVYIFDFGQNISGWVRLRLNELRGKRVMLRFAEMLNPDGSMHFDNLRRAQATDIYYTKGGGEEIWEPHFTYHGFRYVEVDGIDTELGRVPLFQHLPPLNTVVAIAISSALRETGSFACGDPLVERLVENIQWSRRDNFIDIPTDCPQRDERLGWTGDAAIFIATSGYLCQQAAFYGKWLEDLVEGQREDGCVPHVVPSLPLFGYGSAGWGDAVVLCPWQLYWAYGDVCILREHYIPMTRWLTWLEHRFPGGLCGEEGYGDWLSINAETPRALIATAYYGQSAQILAQVAEVLDVNADVEHYSLLFEHIKAAFNDAFVDHETGLIRGDSQTAYALALDMNLLDDPVRDLAFHRLCSDVERRGVISTGFLGVRHINLVLSRYGRSDLAYKLLCTRAFPSWLYEVEQGATTIWERWDGKTTDGAFFPHRMNSFNHYAFGSIGEWLFSWVGGIAPLVPGYKEILLRPQPDASLGYVRTCYDSIAGCIRSEWTLDQDNLILELEIPANTSAILHIPRKFREAVIESGIPLEHAAGIEIIDEQDTEVICRLQSGVYTLTTTYASKMAPSPALT